MLDIRLDNALSNVVTGLGTRGRDASLYNALPMYGYVPSFEEQSEWRRRSWACRKIIDIPPRYMVREFGEYKINDDNPKVADAVNKVLKTLKVRAKFQEAQAIANLRGNSGIIMMIDDGETYDKPVQWGRVKEVPKLSKVYSCRYLRPDTTADSIDIGEDSKPGAFYISGSYTDVLIDAKGKSLRGTGDRVHGDRVLWFRGAELDEDARLRNNLTAGCDDSVLVNFIDVWMRYATGIEALATAMHKSNILMHGIEGLLGMLLEGGTESENRIGGRLRSNQLMMSSYRGVVYDKDKETVNYLSANMGGYGEGIDRLKEEMIAASNLAPSIFYLTFASGIDAAGKIHSEQQAINAELRSLQETKFDDNMNHLLRVIHAAKEGPTKGKEPESWDWHWRNLYNPTDAEKAQLYQQVASLDMQYMQMAAAAGYTPDWEKAVLKDRFGKPEFGIELTIDFDELDRLAEERAAQAEEEAAFPAEGEEFPEEEPLPEEAPPEEAPVENLDSADAMSDKEWRSFAEINPEDVLAVMEDLIDG